MVLWFRITEGKPLYTFDVRGRGIKAAKSWSSTTGFDKRANFHLASHPAHLLVNDLKLTDQGVYRCRVDFKNSRTRNSLVNLTVVVPPSMPIIYNGDDFEVTSELGPYTEGNDIHVKCRVRGGKPEPIVSWFVNGILLDSTSYINGYGDVINEYIFESVNRSHLNSIFTCKASNTRHMEPVERSVALDLILSPLFVRLKRKQIDHVVAGTEYHMSCETAGSRPSAKVKWMKKGKEITLVNTQELDDGNYTISKFVFVPAAEDNGASLYCRVYNPAMNDNYFLEDSWHLNVLYLPEVKLSLGSTLNPTEIKIGSDVYMECKIKANPRITKLQWLHDGKLLRQSIGSGVIMSNQSLVLQGINRKTAGNYTCSATNSLGSTESNAVNLHIMHAPVCVNEGGITVGAIVGESIGLRCSVESNPSAVTFEWEFHSTGDNVDVIPNGKTISQDNLSRFFYVPTESSFGTFLCWGRNSIGRQIQPCVFHVIPAVKPEPLEGCIIANQTETTIQVECNSERELPPIPAHPLAHIIDLGEDTLNEQQAHQSQTDYGIFLEYYVMEVWDIKNRSIRRNLSSETPVFTLKGLVPGSWLKLILYAANSHGKSEPVIMEAVIPGGMDAQIFGESYRSPLDIFPLVVLGIGTTCAGILSFLIPILICRTCCQQRSLRSTQSRHLLSNVNSTTATPAFTEKVSHLHHNHGDDDDVEQTVMLMSTLVKNNVNLNSLSSYETILCSKTDVDKNPDIIPAGNYLLQGYDDQNGHEGGFPLMRENKTPAVDDTSNSTYLQTPDAFDVSYQQGEEHYNNYNLNSSPRKYLPAQISSYGQQYQHQQPLREEEEVQEEELQPLNISTTTTDDPSSSFSSSSSSTITSSSKQRQMLNHNPTIPNGNDKDYNTIYIRDKLLYDSKIPESCV